MFNDEYTAPLPSRRATTAGSSDLRPFTGSPAPGDYERAYRAFTELAARPGLDDYLRTSPDASHGVETALERALAEAFDGGGGDAARLFLQRVLYAVNRLKLFWYDDLASYDNERSDYLRHVRTRIEARWTAWEMKQIDTAGLRTLDVEAAIRARCAADLDPPMSAAGRFFAEEAQAPAYRTLLEIASLDGLVEASQLSRTLGGVSNEIHARLTRVLLEEYGYGRPERKHSTFFAAMLEELGMDATPEAHFASVPWAVLAAINHSFLVSERKRHFLRYVGGLLYTEISVPAAFRPYSACAERLGLRERAHAYWDLHIREDERHGRWMLNDVALPLLRRYPDDGWEIVLGYDQQRLMSERAGRAVAEAARAADRISSRQTSC